MGALVRWGVQNLAVSLNFELFLIADFRNVLWTEVVPEVC